MNMHSCIRTALATFAITSIAAMAHAQIKIGLVFPTTGTQIDSGQMAMQGVSTAVEKVNAAGGINGQKIETVVFDDGCSPSGGPTAASQVLDAKIHYVVGMLCSGGAIAAAPIYNSQHVVTVTPAATSPALTNGMDFHYIFRTIGPDDDQGTIAARFAIDKIKPRRVAILHDKQAYGRGIANTARKIMGNAGIDIALYEGITPGQKDYFEIVDRLKAAEVNFVYFGGYANEMGLLMRDAREKGLTVKMMGPEAVATTDIHKIGGPAIEGMLVTLPADFSVNPKNASIVKAFTDKKRDPSGAYQLTAYAAAQVIMDSIKAVGDDPKAVADYMHKTTFDTPLGPTSWKSSGDLTSFEFQVFEWHKDGSKSLAK